MSKAKVTAGPWEVYEGYVILNSHGKKRSCMGWVRRKRLHADVGGNSQEILDMETLRVIGSAWLTSSPPIDLHLLPTPTAQEPAGDETRRAVAIEPLLEQVRTLAADKARLEGAEVDAGIAIAEFNQNELALRATVTRLEEELAKAKQIDAESAEYVESVICMRTNFSGEPPYVGWKGLGFALNEALDERDTIRGHLTAAIEDYNDDKAKLEKATAALAGKIDWPLKALSAFLYCEGFEKWGDEVEAVICAVRQEINDSRSPW